LDWHSYLLQFISDPTTGYHMIQYHWVWFENNVPVDEPSMRIFIREDNEIAEIWVRIGNWWMGWDWIKVEEWHAAGNTHIEVWIEPCTHHLVFEKGGTSPATKIEIQKNTIVISCLIIGAILIIWQPARSKRVSRKSTRYAS